MTVHVSNAFSINMLNSSCCLSIDKITLAEVKVILSGEFTSHIGHADMANVMSELAGISIPMNRDTYTMLPDDLLIVGQYTGPRLAEGTTALPEGAAIEWWLVTTKA